MSVPSAREKSVLETAERAILSGFDDQVDGLMIDESRRGARLVLPFLLPTLYLVWVVLGEATGVTSVRVAFGAAIVVLLLRLAVLSLGARPESVLSRSKHRGSIFMGTAWLVSGGFAGVYVAAGPELDSLRLLTLAILATAVCALAIMSASSSVFSYVGYVTIHLVPLAAVMQRHADPSLTPLVPMMVIFFVVALTIIALRSSASLREKIQLSLKVRDFGLRDALTGLRNRAFVNVFTGQRARQILEQWESRGRRVPSTGRRLALLLVDLDHFKKVNDRFGHAVGDDVLTAFASTARAAVRAGDIVARWGGEEFLVVMEVEDRAAAHVVAERLREMLASTPVPVGASELSVTCSIGAAVYPFDPSRPADLTWQETLELADAALYRAKAEGRNRTAWAKPNPKLLPRDVLAAERANDAPTQRFRKAA